MWQLKATPSSQSSRKSATTSLDQSCPKTSTARHSLLSSDTSQPREVSHAEQEPIHSGLLGQPYLSMSPKSEDSLPRDPAAASAAKRCRPINAHAVSAETQVFGRHFVRNRHQLLLDKEEKELAIRPILPQEVPTGGCCTQAHTVPWVQARPDAFPIGPSPHLLQNLGTHKTAGHCNPDDFELRQAQEGILQAI